MPPTGPGGHPRPYSQDTLAAWSVLESDNVDQSTIHWDPMPDTKLLNALKFHQVDAILATEPAIGAPLPAAFSCGPGRLAPAPGGVPAAGRFYGCDDVDYTPAYPLTIRLMATLYLD